MKDNFSAQASLYARFRPGYPQQLYDFLTDHCPGKKAAWDCGTGNGQVAAGLSPYFEKVFATDISKEQIAGAPRKDNIFYSVEASGQSSFPSNRFDLITVGQAVHWFDLDLFYAEARRTLQPGGLIAVFGYELLRVNPEIDRIVGGFYSSVVGPYWDEERKWVDDRYASLPFPFKEINTPEMYSRYEWQWEEMVGYLNTWSAVRHYENKNHENPVDLVAGPLQKAWGNAGTKAVSFPVFVRAGRK
jgi:SAM-dependent methyltransferase